MQTRKLFSIILAIQIVWPFFFLSSALALTSHEILVVANRNARGSIDLAESYMQKRGVPRSNLLKIFVTDAETCSRADYDKLIAQPIRKKLGEYSPAMRPRCIVTIKGVPLKVAAVPLTAAEKAQIDELKADQKRLKDELKALTDESRKKAVKDALDANSEKIKAFQWKHDTAASVDSELMLVTVGNYPLAMWVPNPYFPGFTGQQAQMQVQITKDDVVMVSRLDAPEDKMVERMIDDAMAAEKTGLKGTAFFDARYKDPGGKKVDGYALYDKSIHLAADRIRRLELMPVVVEDTQKLFQKSECPQAALYCGWYSLARYVDAFEWVPGAIGYHIASQECQTLRPGKSQAWCKRMLEEGVSVVIGPVGEPYVQAFPLPEIFFGLLAEKGLTVVESYLLSLPFLSWKMVLVGDPLYRPFQASFSPS